MSKHNSTALPTQDKSNKATATGIQPAVVIGCKPSKPRPDFPLTPHRAGYWCKKILGRVHYFGPRFKPGDAEAAAAVAEAALDDYNRQADALHSGRKPRPDTEGTTVKDAVNHFLYAKVQARDLGELSPRTYDGYKAACDEIVATFTKGRLVADLDPEDFARLRNRLANRLGPHGLGTWIQCIRCCFKFAADNQLVERQVQYGASFKKPSKKTLRKHKAGQGARLFTAKEVRTMLDAAVPSLRAMILLAINAGFGNADCANLPITAVDLDAGMIDFPRPKTGIPRRCPLWPETVAAIRGAIEERTEPKSAEHAALVFITRCGDSWAKPGAENPISDMTSKLLRRLKIRGSFYTLRHTHRTVADEVKDQPAADFIMGHENQSMATVYRERISDERLRAVTDHVRSWLFAKTEG